MRKILALMLLAAAGLAGAQELPLEKIKLPPGFRIELFARVENARAMTLGAQRTLFVGSMRAGKVHALTFDTDYRVTRSHLIASELKLPVGVAFRNGALYVSAVDRILRFDGIERRLADPPTPVALRDTFPKDTHHGWRFIAFGPDGKLYVPVGAPCNICAPDPDRYANITRIGVDAGTGVDVFARGVRNTVGFDWHPQSGELWFTDNGRDWLGDDAPPDELNHAPRAGMHFGYPHCHGGTLPDPEYARKSAKGGACAEFAPPAQNLGAHVAALGMRFYTGAMFPAEYRNQIFIAEHGSWNRSTKSGYRISLVRLRGAKAVGYETFAQGWLDGERVWGRPADVLVLPDGSLLVSDDHAGAVYRISYGKR